jgi:hypothetical protein
MTTRRVLSPVPWPAHPPTSLFPCRLWAKGGLEASLGPPPVLGQGSILSRSSADADIEPVTEPLGLEGLLPDERLGVRLSQPHLRWLGEEMALQG